MESKQHVALFNEKQILTASLTPWLVFFVGLHSIALGSIIYFFTDFFYQQFFSASVENIFFVRQSGVFLFLAGLYYLYPLLELEKLYGLILLIVVSKVVAVLFLISNAKFTLAPPMIYLAAFFDGAMALLLTWSYFHCKKKFGTVQREEQKG